MMKNALLKPFLSGVIFLISLGLFAQDPEFTQFYATPIYTNPAFAGSECGRLAAAYRMQYFALPGGFVTFNASYDQRVKKIGGGFGIMFTNDKAGEGVLTNNSVNTSYAYELMINRYVTVRLGIQAGFFQKSLQWDKLRWGDQIIETLGFENPTQESRIDKVITVANFAAGGLIYSEKFYAGIACHNLTQPYQTFFNNELNRGTILPRRYTVHGGLVIPLDNKREPEATFSPNILFMAQGKFNQVNVGFYLNKGALVTGVWYRQSGNADALMALVGFRQGSFKFGYSIDFTVSDLRSAGKNSHEFTMTYEFCSSNKPGTTYPRLRCPTF